ncbi:uncharacterized protein BDZ99DRAFT_573250 [Mytilinidion resinicola]|uniref:DUF6604 domain-containing protein n=1 Tax=Mytilinidion resinicola TaxID=574789 RepID=A0A6A6YFA7_9PEZI|nr:uncharacterized protein BDZ99DRAFT_573250 [Mytilinidion resinicola]KAF2807420.1 hypothetical protein BDZ99DRAFT_573250 [Mytilinidion resinicola]
MQYKSDTEKIGGWLPETLKWYGYDTEILSEGPSEGQRHAASARLKGKARKIAREAAKQAAPGGYGDPAAQYKMRVSDFVPMAHLIASYNLSVPAIVRRLFSRAITARRKCADWFSQHSQQEKDSNSKHVYFIGILEIERDEEEVKAEFLFAIQCFLGGLQELRQYLGRSWKSYKEGRGKLLIASVTTYTAIAFVRLSELEFDHSITRPKECPLSKYPTWCLPCVLLFESLVNRADLPKDEVILPSQFYGTPSKPMRLEEITMFKVYSLLKNYVPKKDSPRGKFTITVGFASVLRDAGEDPRIVRLAECLPEICKIASASPCRFAEDEFSYGMRHLLLNKEVPIWLTFAAQMFVYTQDILGPETRQHLDDVKNTVRQALKWHEGHTAYFELLATHQKNKSEMRKDLNTIMARGGGVRAYVLEDKFSLERGPPWVLADEVFLGLDPSTEHYYLRSNPLRCGLLKYYALMQRHHKDHYTASEQMHVMSMAHLYAACRILHPQSPKWADMEFLIARQTSEHLFFGGWPQALQDSENKFLLVIGMPSNGTARGRRSASVKLNKKVRRFTKGQSLFFEILNERVSGMWDNVDCDTAKLREMFRDDQVWKHIATRTHSQHELSGNKWRDTPSLSDFTACVWLRCGLSYGAPDFCFDWLSMHRTCEGIFRAFGEAPAVTGIDPWGHSGETTFAILSRTGRAKNNTYGNGTKNVKEGRSAPVLNVVSDLIQDVCKRGYGDKEIHTLRSFSYGGRTDYGRDLWKLETLSPLYGGDDLVPKDLYSKPVPAHETTNGVESSQSQRVEEGGLVQEDPRLSVSEPGGLAESRVCEERV